MATNTVQKENIREIKGVNLLDDARIVAPGSWAATGNMYGKTRATLVKRPGSTLVVNGGDGTSSILAAPKPYDDGKIDAGIGPAGESKTTTVAGNSFGGMFGSQEMNQGSHPLIRPIINNSIPAGWETGLLPANTVPQKVTALARLYFDLFAVKNKIIGVYAYNAPHPDAVFYVNSSNQAQLVPAPTGSISTHGADWQIVKYRYNPVPATAGAKSYHAILTNGVNQPLLVKDGSMLSYQTNILLTQMKGQPSDTTIYGANAYLCGVRHMTVYQGQIVYSGYAINDGTTLTRFQDRACFSDVNAPHSIASNNGAISDLIIGDGEFEPLVAAEVNAISTDSVGANGNLVFFTGRKIVTYTGSLPTTGNPVGADFSSILTREFGCWAAKSIVRTPKGLIFLGSDGIIYLMPLTGGIVPISFALEPFFKQMTPRYQAQCAATYWRGWYILSTPGGTMNQFGVGTTQFTPFPNTQWWADVRGPFDPSQVDMGVRWFGPMTGCVDNCFAQAQGYEDTFDIYSGSAINGSVYKRCLEGTYTDPDPKTGSNVAIGINSTLNLIDRGDAHIDKTVKAVGYAASTDIGTTLTTTLVVVGQTAGTVDGEQWANQAIAPQGATFDNATFDTSNFSADNTLDLIINQTSDQRRGRAFSVSFLETPPAAGAALFLSDVQFRVIHAERDPRSGE